MKTLRHLAFSILFLVICFCSISNKAGHILIDQYEIPSQSFLEGRHYQTKPLFSIDSYSDKTFQSQSEQYFADLVPVRDNIILANAAIQRCCIAAANSFFHFKAIPTYYSADTVVIPEDGLILPISREPSKPNDDAADKFVAVVNDLAAKYPDIRFVFETIQSPYDSPSNPTYNLCSNTYGSGWSQKHIVDALAETSVVIIEDTIKSYDELKNSWFSTEHHWKLERALQSYNLLAEKLELYAYHYDNPVLVAPKWYGARCRLGLDLDYYDSFWDLSDDFSDLEWLDFNGKSVSFGKREDYYAGTDSFQSQPLFNVYDSFYGSLKTKAVNRGTNNGKRCLVICVSYTRALKAYIASNYLETTFIAPTINKIDQSFEDILKQGQFDDVIIQMSGTSYQGLQAVSPVFLSQG